MSASSWTPSVTCVSNFAPSLIAMLHSPSPWAPRRSPSWCMTSSACTDSCSRFSASRKVVLCLLRLHTWRNSFCVWTTMAGSLSRWSLSLWVGVGFLRKVVQLQLHGDNDREEPIHSQFLCPHLPPAVPPCLLIILVQYLYPCPWLVEVL